MKTVRIPWGAWYQDSFYDLEFPDNWTIHECPIQDYQALGEEEISHAIQNPIGTNTLEHLAKEKNRDIIIAVEDITRPARIETVLQKLLVELKEAGIKDEQIRFLICNGAHSPMSRHELALKVGKKVLANFMILNHNPYDNLIDTGIVLGKNSVHVNSFFYQASLKIGVGSIVPHSFAGFSSGGKLVLPGLSDIVSLERSHKFVMMGFRGGVNDVETNKFRLEIEDVAAKIGLDFYVGLVPNARREVAGLFAGHFVQAHRQGVEFGRKIFRTKVPGPSDILVLNAYPKDTELLQTETAFTPLKTIKTDIVKEDGIVMVMSACSNGLGYHDLFGQGMRLYKKPSQIKSLKGRELLFFSPNINKAEFYSVFWNGYSYFNSWQSAILMLKTKFKEMCTVTVLPCAPLQLLEN